MLGSFILHIYKFNGTFAEKISTLNFFMILNTTIIQVGTLEVKVIQKDVKKMYIRLRRPDGRVEVTMPLRMSMDDVHEFVFAKRSWVAKHQEKIEQYATHREESTFSSGEKHFFLGKEYALQVIPSNRVPQITLTDTLNLYIDPLMPISARKALLDTFYYREFRKLIPTLFDKWTKIIKISPKEVRIKKVKTRWGSCNPVKRRIHLNLDLIKAPYLCIEYVFVHEMVHFLVDNHGKRFYHFMDLYLPSWPARRKELKIFSLKNI